MPNLLSPGTAFAGLFGPDALLSSSGSPVTNTAVTVYQSDGTTVATLYTDQTRATTAANPTSTDSYGNLAFYTNPGLYILSFSVGGIAQTKTVEVKPWFSDAVWNQVHDVAVSGGSTFSPVSGDFRMVDATNGPVTYNLPSSSAGARIGVLRLDSSTNTVTLNAGSHTIAFPDSTYGASITLPQVANLASIWMFDGAQWRPQSATMHLPLASLSSSGASTGQVPVWNGSTWVPGLPGATLIQSQTIASGTSGGITFANIPTTYTHLLLVASLSSTWASGQDYVHFYFNGDTGSDYYVAGIYGGYALSTGTTSTYTSVTPTYTAQVSVGALLTPPDVAGYGMLPSTAVSGNAFANYELLCLNYANTTLAKGGRIKAAYLIPNTHIPQVTCDGAFAWVPATQAAITNISFSTYSSASWGPGHASLYGLP